MDVFQKEARLTQSQGLGFGDEREREHHEQRSQGEVAFKVRKSSLSNLSVSKH